MTGKGDIAAAALSAAAIAVSLLAKETMIGAAVALAAAAFVPGFVAVRFAAPRLRGSLGLALSLALSPVVLGVAMTLLMLVGCDARSASTLCMLACAGSLGYAIVARRSERDAGADATAAGTSERRGIGIPSVVLAIAIGLLVAWPLATSNRVRTSIHGMLHCSILFRALDGGVPPENPFFAGQPLRYYWTWHLAMAVPVELGGVDPTVAFAAANVAALFAFLLLLAHAGALLARDGPAARFAAPLAVVLGFTSLNPLGAFGFDAESQRLGLAFSPLERIAAGEDPIRYVQALTLGAEDRLSATITKFFNVSSFPGALALLAAAWVFAARVVGKRSLPDFLCLLLSIAGCIALSPITGLTGGFGIGAGAIVALVAVRKDPDRRNAVLATIGALGAGLVLAIPFVLMSGGDDNGAVRLDPTLAKLKDDAVVLLPALALALPAMLGALLRLFLRRGSDESGGGAGGVLAIAALALLPLAVVLGFPVASEYKLVREAAPLLGVFAAVTIASLRVRRPALGIAIGVLAIGLFLPTTAIAWNAYRWHARASLPFSWHDGVYSLDRASFSVDEIYTWLRANTPADAVILDDPRAATNFAGRFHQAEPPAIAQRSVFSDSRSYMNDYEPALGDRLYVLESIYGGKKLTAEEIAVLESTGRPVYLLLRADSPRHTATRLGLTAMPRFERVFQCAGGQVYKWKLR